MRGSKGAFLGLVFSMMALLVLPAAVVASHTFPPGVCQADIDGANDEPGQKDVTQWCAEPGDWTNDRICA